MNTCVMCMCKIALSAECVKYCQVNDIEWHEQMRLVWSESWGTRERQIGKSPEWWLCFNIHWIQLQCRSLEGGRQTCRQCLTGGRYWHSLLLWLALPLPELHKSCNCQSVFLDPTGSLAFTLWVGNHFDLNTWILAFLNTWLLEYLITWLLEYLNTWILG